jgi:hypothetical protein
MKFAKTAYDVHVAAEIPGANKGFQRAAEALGFKPDNLVENHIFAPDMEASACPIIDVHHSLKFFGEEMLEESIEAKQQVEKLFGRFPKTVGYYHIEATLFDRIITPDSPNWNAAIPFPFKPTQVNFLQKAKVSDMHIAFKAAEVGDEFLQAMYAAGMYSIRRNKQGTEWIVLTLQFDTQVGEAKQYFEKFIEYMNLAGGPSFTAKFEVTVNERGYNNATLPPVAQKIELA